jgi:hypothetical protein
MNKIQNFKPQLLPNNPVGEEMDWEFLLKDTIQDYYCSIKEDGARVELQYETPVMGRSLKVIKNVHIQKMHEELQDSNGKYGGIIEAEFFSPNMTFSEIMHFFKTEDVESQKSKEKYAKLWGKTNGDPAKGWPYPGRTVVWLTTWQPCLKFYAFDYYLQDNLTKAERTYMLEEIVEAAECKILTLLKQHQFDNLDMMYHLYDQAKMQGSEGLVLIHKNSPYKRGRHTLKSAMAYKIKEDNIEFDGKIMNVEEATEAREGAPKTTNELGRSVTSKLQEDRIPSGMAKGFKVWMEDGNELIVSLKGYDHAAKRGLLENKSEYIGRWITFTGMAPVKEGGCPRHAHFSGRFRDDK